MFLLLLLLSQAGKSKTELNTTPLIGSFVLTLTQHSLSPGSLERCLRTEYPFLCICLSDTLQDMGDQARQGELAPT